nr:uncharacterized protein LOC104097969 [Nicotiana tomentosiformis]
MVTENILLAQEIAQNINKNNRVGNMIIKLDTAKAYDRMPWNFLMSVMKKFDFSEEWIDLIWDLVDEIWYSIINNDTRKCFFTLSQGLKQGDPLSPSLFIIGVEVLTKSLNSLIAHANFTPFTMDHRGPVINHLAYVDDIVIFSGGNNASIKLIKKQIRRYEKASRQKVNNDKSFFITAPNTSPTRINKMRQASGFMEKNPFYYLGCLIYYGRKTTTLFDGMLSKIVKELNGWQDRMMSIGGRAVLIKHFLQSMPTYILSAMASPKDTIRLMKNCFANFFSGANEGKNNYHWSS